MRVFTGCRVKYVGDVPGMTGKRGKVLGKSTLMPRAWLVCFDSTKPVGYMHLCRWEFVITSRKYKPVR